MWLRKERCFKLDVRGAQNREIRKWTILDQDSQEFKYRHRMIGYKKGLTQEVDRGAK